MADPKAVIEPRAVAEPKAVAELDEAPLLSGRPAAVVFDCDGLLVDTEPSWTVAESAVFATRGLTYDAAQKQIFLGRSVPDTVALMAELFGETGNEALIYTELMGVVGEVISAQASAMPGAVELVNLLRRQEVPIGVASNSPHELVELSLAKAGLTGAFGVIMAADEVAAPKPAADLYLAACAGLGADPAASLAFEDSATGVIAARAAGMTVVGVPTLAADLPADLVLPSLADDRLLAWAHSL